MNRKITISPSLLACDFIFLEDEIFSAVEAGADVFHADVMDGVYVPNISFGFDIIKKIKSISTIPVDAHLMIKKPYSYIDVLADSGVESVTVHTDFDEPSIVRDTLESIKKAGMKAGIALRPKFSASAAEEYLDVCDMLLCMTVEPGFGGQKFMPDMLSKISNLRRIADGANRFVSVQVDGGISPSTIRLCSEAGADNFVIGTAFFGAENRKSACAELRRLAECR